MVLIQKLLISDTLVSGCFLRFSRAVFMYHHKTIVNNLMETFKIRFKTPPSSTDCSFSDFERVIEVREGGRCQKNDLDKRGFIFTGK
jgi:hypothetical protein